MTGDCVPKLAAYVVYGTPELRGRTIGLSEISGAWGFFTGWEGDPFEPWPVVSALGVRDMDGDGLNDLLTYGEASKAPPKLGLLTLLGSAERQQGELSLIELIATAPDLVKSTGLTIPRFWHEDLAIAAEMSGDGIPDPVLWSHASPDDESNGGIAIIDGAALSVPTITGIESVIIWGREPGENLGGDYPCVRRAGDFNGDGFQDLLVSASHQVFGLEGAPRIYIVLGGERLFSRGTIPVDDLQESGMVIEGMTLGAGPAGVPGCLPFDGGTDFNGDGVDDIAIASQSPPLAFIRVLYGSKVREEFFLVGDTNGDGALDIGDAIRLLTHLFAEMPVAVCQEALDVDGSGAIDIGDPIWLLVLLFASGPAPAHPFPTQTPCPQA
ncbi:MAG: FG-GAP repeat protein [Planctomycetes bacterium]|nr:FG-GAP repeat protein [Planctomycetota bacterium]